MKKVLLALLSVAIAFTALAPAQAQDQKVLAIIDTAIDSKNFSSIIYEVCFSQNLSCPNKTNFVEGPGAASAVVWPKSLNDGTHHGDWMTKAALKVDPSVKIVFIRYSNVTASGSSANRPESLVAAIDWVSKNSDKYSIDALSISQAAVDTGNLSRCNVNSPNFDNVTTGAVSLLNAKNIPVFVATGNHARSDVIGWPACTPGAIGVGALTTATSLLLEKATNRGPGLDIVTFGALEIYKGTIPTAKFNLSGSSGATVVSATTYLKNNTYKTFQEYFNALPKIVINTVSYSRN
jgi:hypothetical protein